MSIRLLFILALSLWAAVVQATPSLDLWQAWQLALQRDPIYAAQRANTQANQEQITQARAKLLPSIEAVASAQHNDSRRASRLNQGHNSNLTQWQLRLSQPLLDLNAIAQFERSRYLAGMAVLDLENAKHELALRVTQAYFDVLSAQDTLLSLQAQYNAIEQQLLAAQLAFELGGATITDTYEAQSRLDLLKAQQITAQSFLQNKQNALSRMIGEPVHTLAPLNPNAILPAPEPAQLDAWTTQASLSNLFVAKANLAVQAQRYQLQASQREHTPTVSLEARSGSQSNQGIYGPNSSPRALDSSIAIELSIPLYQGGAISSRIRENASVLQQRHLEQENARRQAIESTQNHFSNVTAGLLQIQALEAAAQSSSASVQANQTAYEVGVRINIDVLNAQQQHYETQRALAQARYQALIQGLALKKAAGQLQDSDLDQLNQLLLSTP